MARNAVDWDDDDDDFGGDDHRGNDIPDLRKAYNSLKRQYKELQTQYDEAQKAVRERSVKDVLAAKGVNTKIAAFIPADLKTEQEIEAWIDDYSDVFGVQSAPAPTDEAQPAAAPDPNMEAWARISQQQASGQPMSMDEAQLEALVKATANPAALNKLLFGNEFGPQAQ